MQELDGLRLKSLLEHANIGVVIHRWDTSIVYANPAALRLLRLNYEQILGKDAFDTHWRFIDDAGRPIGPDEYPVNKVKSARSPLHNEILGVTDSSAREISWLMVNAYIEGDSSAGFIVVSFNDISETKRQFSAEAILHNTQDIVIVTDAVSIDAPFGPKIVYVNKAFELLTGYSASEVLGETPRILQGKDTSRKTLTKVRQDLQNQKSSRFTILNYAKSGQPYWLDVNIIPLENRYGEVTHFAAIERDITSNMYHAQALESRNNELKKLKASLEELVSSRTEELQKVNKYLQRQAYFDVLTQLPNRRCFLNQSSQQASRMQRMHLLLVTAILDVDNFKRINDKFGHDSGDAVLVAVANCIAVHFRHDDVFGRYGGEEFAFSLIVEHENTVSDVLERLRKSIENLEVDTGSGPMKFTVSIGAHVTNAEQFLSLTDELSSADIALYQAKNAGRNQIVINSSISM